MKKIPFLLAALALLPVFNLAGQSKSANAMSLNGSTGLYVVPSANLGFEDANVGINGGYIANFADYYKSGFKLNDLFKFNASLFRLIELSAAYDGQPFEDDDDILIGAKFKLPVKASNVALGGNVSYNDFGAPGNHLSFRAYAVVTYDAEFFTWPSETTLYLGKTFFEGQTLDSSLDFGMGFELILLPNVFDNFVHWIIDFSNFDYNGYGLQAAIRGTLNTGLRIDLSQVPQFGRFKFVIDAFVGDVLDDGSRSFGVGGTFGVKF